MADRFAAPVLHPSGVHWAPSDFRETDQSPYLDYLDRVERGAPTGRARLRQLYPDPPCHTGGGGPLSACPCGAAG